MHELGIAEAALRQTLAHAHEARARHVARVVLRIGAVSGVDPEAFRFAFDALLPGTIAEGATLEINVVPARVRCPTCAQDFAPGDDFIFNCPACQRVCTELTSGRELELCQLEVA